MSTSKNIGGSEHQTTVLSCRVSKRFADLVRQFCRLDMHLNPADLLRDSIREKIEREAPELYKQLFQEVKLVE